MDWLTHYLTRVGRVSIENPVWLVGYTVRLVASFRYTVAGIFSPAGATELAQTLARQTFKTFFRGVFPVLALSLAAAAGFGWVSVRLGSLARGAFDELVVPILVSHVVPLCLAVVLVARTGATIAVRFAVLPLEDHSPVRFAPRDLQQAVVPHLVASVVTAGAFYMIVVWLLLTGYHAAGLEGAFRVDLSAYFSLSVAWPPIWNGARKALVFGAVVAVAASGLGIQVAERYDRTNARGYPYHYVVWETVLVVTVICTILTVVL